MSMNPRANLTTLRSVALIAITVFFGAHDGFSQEFGRNKVQYENFDMRVLRTGNFALYHYPSIREASTDALSMLERWNRRFEQLFDHSLNAPVPVILYASHTDFQQTNAVPGLIPAGVGGVTESRQGRIVVPLSGAYGETNHVLGHELVHAFHFDLISASGGRGSVPLWFVEGMAEYATLGRIHPQTTMWLRDAVARDDLPTLRRLGRDPSYSPYRYGHAIWAYIGERYGDRAAFDLYKESLRLGFRSALRSELNVTIDELSEEWHASIRETVAPQAPSTLLPLSEPIDIDSDIVVSPVLSPDGRHAALFTRRDVFSLGLYLVDLETGKLGKRLALNRRNPHFDALRFIDSAGAFSPSGDRFAFVTQKSGDNAVSVVRVETGRILRTVTFDGIEAISSPAWSPDGSSLALSATHGGTTDLYLYSLSSGELRQLTDDRYYELQPDFSPDGSRIVFSTDRPRPRPTPEEAGTDLSTLRFGNAALGVLDIDSGTVEVLSIHPTAYHVSPHFYDDGASLVFVSDPNGVADVYRLDLASSAVHRITAVSTGVSGFTALSPALTAAADQDRIAFTVYKDGAYALHTLDGAHVAGIPVNTESMSRAHGAAIVPSRESDDLHAEVLADTSIPLDESTIRRNPYRPELRLSGVGQAVVGVTGTRFGTAFFASVSASFEDVLGSHLLLTTAQVTGSARDVGGSVFYLNRTSRLEWGLTGEHLAGTVSRSVPESVEIDVPDGTMTTDGPTKITSRRFYDRASVSLRWPFSRTLRSELDVGYLRIAEELEIRAETGELFVFPVGDPLHLSENEVALVLDTSYSGFTGPLRGQRMRISARPIFGSLNLVEARADYRWYAFLRPIGIASRVIHLGRYLWDAKSPYLSPLTVGSPSLVRGYAPGTIAIQECSTPACPEYERLFGTKLAVANVELRLPLLGSQGLGLASFPYLPITLVGFADAGIAWDEWTMPAFQLKAVPGTPTPVVSAGFAARFNILGALVLQFYYAFPFAREQVGSIMGITLEPGF